MANVKAMLRFWGVQMRSPYNDGWTSHNYKEMLIEVRDLVNELLENAPEFSGENHGL